MKWSVMWDNRSLLLDGPLARGPDLRRQPRAVGPRRPAAGARAGCRARHCAGWARRGSTSFRGVPVVLSAPLGLLRSRASPLGVNFTVFEASVIALTLAVLGVHRRDLPLGARGDPAWSARGPASRSGMHGLRVFFFGDPAAGDQDRRFPNIGSMLIGMIKGPPRSCFVIGGPPRSSPTSRTSPARNYRYLRAVHRCGRDLRRPWRSPSTSSSGRSRKTMQTAADRAPRPFSPRSAGAAASRPSPPVWRTA